MSTILYARQSADKTKDEAAVSRQLKESREFAAQRGITIDLEIVDNDLSATSDIERPGFERLLRSKPTMIITWHQDRLLRLTRDLERVIDLNVPVLTVTAGTLDLSTPAGRAVARTVAAWSQYETEQKGLRQQASNAQRAARGWWQFSNRPYGYERRDGKVQVVEPEAAIIREAYARYLAGETYYSIVSDLNERGVPTISGKPWTISQLRERLRNPAYAGIRTYHGQEVAAGDWEPIIDRNTWERFEAARRRRATHHGWSNKTKHLLSGIVFCGVCGSRMLARPEYRRQRDENGDKIVVQTLQCTAHWCTSRRMEPVEQKVENAVIKRLSAPDALELLRPKQDIGPLADEAQALRERRDDLAALLAEGMLTAEAVRAESAKLTKRIAELQVQIDNAEGGSGLTDIIMAKSVERHWRERLTLAQKRAIIGALMTVEVHRQKSTRGFDPEAVKIEWKHH